MLLLADCGAVNLHCIAVFYHICNLSYYSLLSVYNIILN